MDKRIEQNKKKILISSFDLAIGGVERSLIGLLNQLDYKRYDVDFMLYRHEGEFFSLLPKGPNLLKEIPQYATFRKSVREIVQEGQFPIGVTRTVAKYLGETHGKLINSEEPGYLVIQYGWKFSLPFLPKVREEYDAAISFLWPHYFIGDKVRAKRKIGWVHTDYSNISINKAFEENMWAKVDHIVAVSDECRESFLRTLPSLQHKTRVIENILSPSFVRQQSKEDVTGEMPTTPGRMKLVTVGRLSYAKGIDDAVHACRKLLDKGFDIEWYVVGYGPLEGDIRNLIAALNLQDRFKLLGKKTNPYPYIRTGDIYVQPSRYEGKAVTVREAQILEKPVIITNFPTAKSQVRDGFDGLITPMGIDGIVEGIQKLIDNKGLRERLVTNTLKADYSNNLEVQKLYSLIDS